MANPTQLRPPMPYYGGKQTLAPQIADLFPDHEHYVEPYAGSLAVLLAKRPSTIETVNDLDEALFTFWRVLRDRRKELEQVAELTPHARAEVALARHLDVDTDLEVARRVWVRLTQGRGSNLGDRRIGWRYAATPAYGSFPQHLDGYRSRIPACAERLTHVSLECRPALEVIADYGRHPGVLLYVDPPYVAETRTKVGQYRHEMTDDDHRQLAEALNASSAAVVLSGYPSPLYDEMYAGWHRHEFATQNAQGGAGRAATEVLWSNRPLAKPGTLFDLAEEVAGA